MRYFLKVYRSGSSILAMDVYGDWYQHWYGHWKLIAQLGSRPPQNYKLIAKSVMFKCPT